jgi:hypothetical protein
MDKYGIIYRIINKTNGKSYIGKTKSHYGEKYFGVEGRLKQHLTNAFTPSKNNDCPLFYRAIRKYGKNVFQIEILVICDLTEVDKFEISMIELYMTINDKFGYNIALGGRGRSVVEISEEIREKISKSQTDSQLNIKELIKDGKVVGYRVRRRQNGIVYGKNFGSSLYTVDENFKQANEYLEKIKLRIYENYKLELHKGIYYFGNGYRVNVLINGRKYDKTFSSKKVSMEKKFKYAEEWLDNIRKNTPINSKYDENKQDENMKNITLVKNKKSEIIGYCVKIIYNGKRYKKVFKVLK